LAKKSKIATRHFRQERGDPIVADAVARFEAKQKADEQTLLAQPWFKAAVEHGKKFEAARAAAYEAARPFDDRIKRFIEQHPTYPPQSPISRQFKALEWAAQEARIRAFAAHGFRVEPQGPKAKSPPSAPQQAVTQMDMSRAYGAAREFVHSVAALAFSARSYGSLKDDGTRWKKLGGSYSMAFMAWFELSLMLAPEVRDRVRSVYGAEHGAIRVGKARPAHSVIELVGDEIGVVLRNVLYQDRRCPLDPDTEQVRIQAQKRSKIGWGARFKELMTKETHAAVRERLGIKSWGDALVLMANEWTSQDSAQAEASISHLRFESIDFDDLEVRLGREARSVLRGDENHEANTARTPTWPSQATKSHSIGKREKRRLGARHFTVIEAMLDLNAISLEMRKSAAEIANRAMAQKKASLVKSILADLKASGHVKSKVGADGGYWLTRKGIAQKPSPK
jgi:hypothetical protein